MTRSLRLAGCVVTLSLAVFTTARLPAGENYAFLVGVADYDKKELKPLLFTRSDILEMHQVLVDSGYKRGNIVLMHDDLKQFSGRRDFPEAAKSARN